MATSNSKGFRGVARRTELTGISSYFASPEAGAGLVSMSGSIVPCRGSSRPPGVFRCLFLAFFASLSLGNATGDDAAPLPAKLALSAYTEARQRYHSDTNQAEAAWQFARACFDWGDFSANDEQRAQRAHEGIAASRQAVALDPKLAAGHFYLAYNMGQLARTKLLGALALVRDMERELKSARELDENFDFAGPDRSLGQLYFEAPGWPTSIGDKAKARKHLQRAVELSGRYPDNRLLLMESWIDSREKQSLERDAKVYSEMLPGLRDELTGDRWAASWLDWDRRWKAIQEKLGKPR